MATLVTAQDTFDTFIGSGALSYPWWELATSRGIDELVVSPDWFCVLGEAEGEARSGVIDHGALVRATNRLARTGLAGRPEYMSEDVVRECRAFIRDPEDADFDADLADQVLQFVVFGSVEYG